MFAWLHMCSLWASLNSARTGGGICIGIVYRTSKPSIVEERWALVKLGIVAAVR